MHPILAHHQIPQQEYDTSNMRRSQSSRHDHNEGHAPYGGQHDPSGHRRSSSRHRRHSTEPLQPDYHVDKHRRSMGSRHDPIYVDDNSPPLNPNTTSNYYSQNTNPCFRQGPVIPNYPDPHSSEKKTREDDGHHKKRWHNPSGW